MANKEKDEKKKGRFLKNFRAELKRVVWPTPKQLLNNTIAVVTIVLVIGIVVLLLDFGFEFINSQNVKLQTSIQSKNANTETVEDNNTTSEDNNSDEASSNESSETAENTEENN